MVEVQCSRLAFEKIDSNWYIADVEEDGRKRPREPDSNRKTALLLKFRERNTVVFLAAGVDGNGTQSAVQYLVRHWEELEQKYRDREFVLFLKFALLAESSPTYDDVNPPRWYKSLPTSPYGR